MSEKLENLVSDLKEKETFAYISKAMEEGVDPCTLLHSVKEGMHRIGNKFARGDFFITDFVFSREFMKEIVERLEPCLEKGDEEERLGKVVIGTVAGDIHEIEKDLVVLMLEANGFEVIDVGINVPPRDFVNAIKESGSKVVALSGILPLAFRSMKDTIVAIQEAGLRDRVKIMIGGGEIDERVRDFIGADAYGKDAMAAVQLAKEWIGE